MQLDQLKQTLKPILKPKTYKAVEAEIAQFLADNIGKAFTKEEIFERVFGSGAKPKTAKTAKAGKPKATKAGAKPSGMPIKVVATKGKIKKVFDSQTATAEFLKVEAPTISQALSKGFKVKGYSLKRV